MPRVKVIGYVRVSTEEQAHHGVSIEAQEHAIRAYATLRDLEVAEMVIDAGVSAGKPLSTRPGGQRLLGLVSSPEITAVASMKLDRLFRDCGDALTVSRKWDRCGVALHLLDMGGQAVDTSTAMGRFLFSVLAASAEMERNLIRERTSAALRHKKGKQERTGEIPFGYRLAEDGRRLVEDSDEQAVIKQVLALHRNGLSQRKIVSSLNADLVPARGSCWHRSSVRRILLLAEK